MLPLLLLAAVPQDAAPPREEAAVPRTQVAVIGTIHDGHLESQAYSLEVLAATVRALEPDQLLVEIPPDRLPAAMEEVRRGVPVTEPRVAVFPEYRNLLLHQALAEGVPVVPCAGWTRELADLRRERLAAFDSEERYAEARAAYQTDLERMRARWPGDPSDTDDPIAIHGYRYDARVRDELSIYDRHLNDLIGPGGWTNVNEAHWRLLSEALDRAARKRPGQRLVITFGAGHKYWFLERLRARSDVELIDVRPFLPAREETMQERLGREVTELHAFFEDWFTGRARGPAFARLESVLAPAFELITPDGERLDRGAVLAGVRARAAQEPADPQSFRIRVESFRARPAADGLWIATYEEWQRSGDEERGRLSTALLQPVEPSQAVPTGVLWHHVHETWLPR